MVTTHLYEQAREIVLEHLGLKADKEVIFCSPKRAALLQAQFKPGSHQSLSSRVASDLAERHGIGVRWGCHCAHLLVKRVVGIPRPLEQFQGLIVRLFPRLNLPGVVRVSFGIENTAADVDAPAEALRDLARQPRDGAAKDAKQQMDQFAKAVSERVYSLPDLSTS